MGKPAAAVCRGLPKPANQTGPQRRMEPRQKELEQKPK